MYLANVNSVHSKLVRPSFLKLISGVTCLPELNLCCVTTLTKKLDVNIAICPWTFNIAHLYTEIISSWKNNNKKMIRSKLIKCKCNDQVNIFENNFSFLLLSLCFSASLKIISLLCLNILHFYYSYIHLLCIISTLKSTNRF